MMIIEGNAMPKGQSMPDLLTNCTAFGPPVCVAPFWLGVASLAQLLLLAVVLCVRLPRLIGPLWSSSPAHAFRRFGRSPTRVAHALCCASIAGCQLALLLLHKHEAPAEEPTLTQRLLPYLLAGRCSMWLVSCPQNFEWLYASA